MVKLAVLRLPIRGWWAVLVVALLAGSRPAASPAFAQGQAAKPAPAASKTKAAAPKTAPKAEPKKAAKKPAPSKAAAAKPQLPVKEKIQPVTAGLRDPFKKPEPPKAGVGGTTDLTPRPPGPRGLAVNEMILEGIVRQETSNIMIAVVAGPERRAYFLRVNDPVYHAVVSKITSDSVYFSETYTDPAGHEATREVVKKMPASGEKP